MIIRVIIIRIQIPSESQLRLDNKLDLLSNLRLPAAGFCSEVCVNDSKSESCNGRDTARLRTTAIPIFSDVVILSASRAAEVRFEDSSMSTSHNPEKACRFSSQPYPTHSFSPRPLSTFSHSEVAAESTKWQFSTSASLSFAPSHFNSARDAAFSCPPLAHCAGLQLLGAQK